MNDPKLQYSILQPLYYTLATGLAKIDRNVYSILHTLLSLKKGDTARARVLVSFAACAPRRDIFAL